MTTYSPSQSVQDIGSIPRGRIGRFIVEREIGKGSVGTVYQFRDPLIGRKVAIKILNPQLPSDQRRLFEKHFIQEARAAGRLNHPNIVTVYDADKADDLLFIAMEYLEGRELRDMIASGYQFSYKQIADIIARVANALDYAHQNGVIHRDIKPANIFIVGKQTPKVLDFGIASASRQIADPEASVGFATLTERRLLGTPSYMSPEQTRAETLDARTDIFSLGVVLYQLLCGELPFKGENIQDLLENIEYESPVPPQDIRPDVPMRLAYIAGKALAKKPADRYATAGEMANELNRYIAKERTNQIIATLRDPNNAKAIDIEKRNAPVPETTDVERKKDPNQLPVFAGVAVLAIFVAVSIVAWFSHRIDPKATPDMAAAEHVVKMEKNTSIPDKIAQPVVEKANPPMPDPVVDSASAKPVAVVHEAKVSESKPAASAVAKVASKTTHASAAAIKAVHASTAVGAVQIAVTPWGEVFVDGKSKGVAPPLSRLSLPVGAHNVEIKNGDDHYAVKIQVTSDNEIKVGHHF